ncbi:hypothetical protein [Achromobacter sp. Marseille-Q4962]|uniref:hypothetical protein n=1 Tax=Achromobacter sp. Marseille-Q4962 TaxID=2942202 RepID=UPI002074A547|nr:hypothetical protein [Achromobacter sp. Marseille-Q4962]
MSIDTQPAGIRRLDTLPAVLRGGVPQARIVRLLDELAQALAPLHAAGTVHGAVHPGSVGLDAQGRAHLLAPALGGQANAELAPRAPGYAAFEQYTDDPATPCGPWTDAHALAALGYLMVTGQAPPPALERCVLDTRHILAGSGRPGYDDAFLASLDRNLSLRFDARDAALGGNAAGAPAAGGRPDAGEAHALPGAAASHEADATPGMTGTQEADALPGAGPSAPPAGASAARAPSDALPRAEKETPPPGVQPAETEPPPAPEPLPAAEASRRPPPAVHRPPLPEPAERKRPPVVMMAGVALALAAAAYFALRGDGASPPAAPAVARNMPAPTAGDAPPQSTPAAGASDGAPGGQAGVPSPAGASPDGMPAAGTPAAGTPAAGVPSAGTPGPQAVVPDAAETGAGAGTPSVPPAAAPQAGQPEPGASGQASNGPAQAPDARAQAAAPAVPEPPGLHTLYPPARGSASEAGAARPETSASGPPAAASGPAYAGAASAAVQKPGHEPEHASATEAGRAGPPAAAPAASPGALAGERCPAPLRLNIQPWGEVAVNGAVRGVSPPLKTLCLRPGSYTVTVRNGDLPSHTETVQIQSGKGATVAHRFQ